MITTKRYTLGIVALTFHSSDNLVQRLRGGERPVVFLVGSALTMPTMQGGPGVCNVEAMLQLIRARVSTAKGPGPGDRAAAKRAVAALDAKLAQVGDGGSRYQVAFEQLKALVDGAASVNSVIREAVLKARTVPTNVDVNDLGALARLELSADGWYLGPGVKALGLLVARNHERFGRTVLTTNFDPLIELAIRAAGGQAHAVEKLGDGMLSSPDPVVTGVVHLHGLWRSDTLHTPGVLTVDRAALRSSLARLYQEVTLVVMAYGGWDDVLTAALADIALDAGTKADVIWCFYQRDPKAIEHNYPGLLELFGKLRERVVCYAGIDCNIVLPKLRAAIDGEGEGELLGREAVCDELSAAVQREQAVEILGEQNMKRSRLLAWVTQEAEDLAHVALLSARELARPTPEAFVRRIANAVGRLNEVEAELHRERAVPTADDATRALQRLRGVWILLDDAEALAKDDHGFTESFFAELRAKVQAREIRWISVSAIPLGPLFQRFGISSQFLNDTTKIYAGGLDRQIVERALDARFRDRAPAAMALTGTLPRLVYRMCEADGGDVDRAMQELPTWAEGMCAVWWNRNPTEQALLQRIAAGIDPSDLGTRERSEAANLCKRGLLVEVPAGFVLNGKIWETYVKTRPHGALDRNNAAAPRIVPLGRKSKDVAPQPDSDSHSRDRIHTDRYPRFLELHAATRQFAIMLSRLTDPSGEVAPSPVVLEDFQINFTRFQRARLDAEVFLPSETASALEQMAINAGKALAHRTRGGHEGWFSAEDLRDEFVRLLPGIIETLRQLLQETLNSMAGSKAADTHSHGEINAKNQPSNSMATERPEAAHSLAMPPFKDGQRVRHLATSREFALLNGEVTDASSIPNHVEVRFPEREPKLYQVSTIALEEEQQESVAGPAPVLSPTIIVSARGWTNRAEIYPGPTFLLAHVTWWQELPANFGHLSAWKGKGEIRARVSGAQPQTEAEMERATAELVSNANALFIRVDQLWLPENARTLAILIGAASHVRLLQSPHMRQHYGALYDLAARAGGAGIEFLSALHARLPFSGSSSF